MKYAVIDIGSNSVRYMLTSGQAVNYKLIETTRLGQGLGEGNLSSDSMTRTARAVARFAGMAKQANADRVFVFATEAVRAAKNGAEFCKKVNSLADVRVDVISGVCEAQIGFLGSSLGHEGTVCVSDIGGASSELCVGVCGKNSSAENNLLYRKSLPLGTVRLKDIAERDAQKMHAVAREYFSSYGTLPRFDKLIGIGGTATAAAAISLDLMQYDPFKVHGTVVTADCLGKLQQRLARLTPQETLLAFPCLTPGRADIMLHGIIMLRELLDYLKIDSFTASEPDNMEGYLMLKGI